MSSEKIIASRLKAKATGSQRSPLPFEPPGSPGPSSPPSPPSEGPGIGFRVLDTPPRHNGRETKDWPSRFHNAIVMRST